MSRQFDVSTSLIYKWRREVMAARAEDQFVPAVIVDGQRDVERSQVSGRAGDRGRAGQRSPGDDWRGGDGVDGERGATGAAMIPVPSGVRIWIATGHADMRKGMPGLSLLVQEHFKRDPFAGDVFIFRGRGGSLIKCLWHDGLGLSLYAKRLDRGRFIWPAAAEGVISLTTSQASCLFEGVDWRNPQQTWRPKSAG